MIIWHLIHEDGYWAVRNGHHQLVSMSAFKQTAVEDAERTAARRKLHVRIVEQVRLKQPKLFD